MRLKKYGVILIAIGILLAAFFVLADVYDSDSYQGIGAAQLLGIQFGTLLILLGGGLFYLDRQSVKIKIKPETFLNFLLNQPTIVWVGLAFLIINFFFFVKPMFLNSKMSMFFFNRYIPNTGLLGKDIRTIMTSIEGWLVSGQSAYANGILAYPPLTLILFSPLLLIRFPAFYKFVLYTSLLSYIVASLIIPLAQNKSKDNSIIYTLFALGSISYGLQFELERGQFNLIAFAICYFAIYIFHAHPKFRLFAYLLFSISFQLKIYTGIFALLFIDNWMDWKSIAKRFIGIGFLNFLLLFVLGTGTFGDFLNALTINQFNLTPWNGSSIRSFVFVLSRTGFNLFSEDLIAAAGNNPKTFESIFLSIYVICLLGQIFYAIHRKQMRFNPFLFVTCVIGALVIPTISNDYKLPILIGPTAILLSSLQITGNAYKKVLSITLILIMSAAFFSTLYPFEVKPEIIHNNMPVLFILLISLTIFRFMNVVSKEGMQQGD